MLYFLRLFATNYFSIAFDLQYKFCLVNILPLVITTAISTDMGSNAYVLTSAGKLLFTFKEVMAI